MPLYRSEQIGERQISQRRDAQISVIQRQFTGQRIGDGDGEDTGAFRGEDTVGRILKDKRLVRFQPQPRQRQQIEFGVGLCMSHIVPVTMALKRSVTHSRSRWPTTHSREELDATPSIKPPRLPSAR